MHQTKATLFELYNINIFSSASFDFCFMTYSVFSSALNFLVRPKQQFMSSQIYDNFSSHFM